MTGRGFDLTQMELRVSFGRGLRVSTQDQDVLTETIGMLKTKQNKLPPWNLK